MFRRQTRYDPAKTPDEGTKFADTFDKFNNTIKKSTAASVLMAYGLSCVIFTAIVLYFHRSIYLSFSFFALTLDLGFEKAALIVSVLHLLTFFCSFYIFIRLAIFFTPLVLPDMLKSVVKEFLKEKDATTSAENAVYDQQLELLLRGFVLICGGKSSARPTS